jgi:hypothetical protein
MQSQDNNAEIAALEIQFKHYQKLLDQSIRSNEIFAKTKVIYHDMKIVSDKLNKLKKIMEGED